MDPHLASQSGWYKMDLWRKQSFTNGAYGETAASDDYVNTVTITKTPDKMNLSRINFLKTPPSYKNDILFCDDISRNGEDFTNIGNNIRQIPKRTADEISFLTRSENISETRPEINVNPAPCFSPHGQNNENCALNDRGEKLFSPYSRDSVTSDPEVYTKSDCSAEKLGAQIKRLKEEMLALRSSTAAFQQTMEKVLDELKWIKLVQQSAGSQQWSCNGDYVTETHASQTNEGGNFAFTRRRSIDGLMPLRTDITNGKLSEKQKRHNFHFIKSLSAPGYENLPSRYEDKRNLTDAHGVLSLQPGSYSQTETSYKIPENNQNNDPSMSRARLARGTNGFKTPNTDSKISCLKDPPKFYSTVQGNTKLRVSKCSIDSGYQDLLVPFPHDKSARVPLRNSPTSPPDASFVDLSSSQTVPKLFVDAPMSQATPNLYVNLKKAEIKKINLQQNNEKRNDDLIDAPLKIRSSCPENEVKPVCNSKDFQNRCCFVSAENDEEIKQTKDVLTCKRFTPLQLTSEEVYPTEENMAGMKLFRPIPKQRTLHFPGNKAAIAGFNRSSSLDWNAFNKIEVPIEEEHLLQNQPITKDSFVGAFPLPNKSKFEDLRRSHSLQSPAQISNFPTGVCQVSLSESPQESSVDGRKDSGKGSFLRRASQNCKATEVKTMNLIKDKFYVTKKEVLVEEEREQTSVVRRRSMKLMQEFRVFDINGDVLHPPSNKEVISLSSDINKANSLSKFSPSCPSTLKPSGYFVSPPVAVTAPNLGGIFDHRFKGEEVPTLSKGQTTINFSSPDSIRGQSFNSRDQGTRLSLSPKCFKPTFSDLSKQDSHPQLSSTLSPLEKNHSSLLWFQPSTEECFGFGSLYKGLKANSSGPSAFKPVLSSTTDVSKGFFPEVDSEKNLVEFKRRTSLPSAVFSNKQRYLNELGISSPQIEQRSAFKNFSEVKSSPLLDAAMKVTATETVNTSGRNFSTSSAYKRNPKLTSISSPKNVVSSNCQSEFESKNLFVTSCRVTEATNKEQPSLTLSEATKRKTRNKQERESNTCVKEFMSPTNSQRGINFDSTKTFSHLSFPRSSRNLNGNLSPPHQYETVKPVDLLQNGHYNTMVALRTKKDDTSFITSKAGRDRTPSKKSAVAFLKASFFGKRNKQKGKNKTQEGDFTFFGRDPRSVDVKKTKLERSGSNLTARNKKSKQNEQKSQKRSIVRHFSRGKKREASESDVRVLGESDSLPDRGETRYGNADAEVMERFLEAAVASHHPRKPPPFVKLRQSLRIPKTRSRVHLENRTKDDLHLGTCAHRPLSADTARSSNVHNGQEFTYV